MTGPHLRGLPDLLVVWNRQADFATLHSPRIGRLELQLTEPDRTGDHTSRGEVIVSTPCGLRGDGDRPLDPLAVGRFVRRLSLERSTPGQPTALRASRAA
jgi:hypothetical protein